MHFKVAAELPIDARTFLVERDSAAFRALVAKTQKLGALEIVDGWTDNGVQVFKLVTKPDINRFVPARLRHYLPGDNVEYTDIIRYDPQLLEHPPFKLIVHSIPPIFQKRTTIDCELTIEEVDAGTCRQTLEGDVTIRVLGLGHIAESIICSSLKDVYSGIPQIVERWKVFRDEVLQQPDGREVLFKGRPPLQEDWVSDQVAKVLQAPYDSTNGKQTDAGEPGLPDSSDAADSNNDAAAAAARAGPENTTRDTAKGRQGAAASGDATLPQAPATSPRLSPFASAARPPRASRDGAEDDTQEVEDRRRSIVRFDSETYYEPDDWLPDDLDSATTDSLREDHTEAMTWYREASITGGPPTAIAAADEDTSESESEGGKRPWWRRKHSRSRSATSIGTDSGGGGTRPQPSSPSLAMHHYPDWAAFWDRQEVAKQDPVKRGGTRLGALFGIAVKLNLVKPPHGAAPAVPESPTAASGQGGSTGTTPKRTKSNVSFATPVVNGIREVSPRYSEDEEEDVDTGKLCFCFPMPKKLRNQHA